MRLELLPLGLGLLALVLGALGLLLTLTPLRRRQPRLAKWSLLYGLTGALLVSAWGLLRGDAASSDERLITVTFLSDPSGADVVLGAREAGRTPLAVQLPRGVRVAYRVTPGVGVLLPGRFATYADTVTPQEDTRLSIWLDRLE